MIRTLFAAILFAVSFIATTPATAGTWKSVATWDIEFSEHGCYTVDRYKNGTIFGFGLTKGGEFDLIISNENWNLPAGDRMALVKVDASDWSRHTATALGTKTLVIRIATEEESFRVLQVGSVLNVRLGAVAFGYDLIGTNLMLPELIKCATAVRDYKTT